MLLPSLNFVAQLQNVLSVYSLLSLKEKQHARKEGHPPLSFFSPL